MKERKNFINIKFYQLFLVSFLISSILIGYSTCQILDSESLTNSDSANDTDKVCEKGSNKLQEYYKTGNLELMGIKGSINETDKPEYIDALINIIDEGQIEGDNLTIYGKHLIPVIICLLATILSIPGWICCCSCACCGCCCCCCLKKLCCNTPIYILMNALYAAIIGISIYGLSQSNSIFVSLADTECALLKFVGEIMDGETRETTPKWGGISNIKRSLELTRQKVKELNTGTINALGTQKIALNNGRGEFESNLKDAGGNVQNEPKYKYSEGSTPPEYQLDLAFNFGSTLPSSADTIIGQWYREFDTVANNCKDSIEQVEEQFKLLNGSTAIDSGLNTAVTQISTIEDSISSIQESISDFIINNSDNIDTYGKKGFKIIFSVLTALGAAMAALMFLLCFCSGEKCKYCCFIRCGLKLAIHLSWNIIALLMILTFLISTIFVLVGIVGRDLTFAVSYLVGSDNLGKGEDAKILGEAGDKLDICINQDGNLTNILNINSSDFNSFGQLRSLENQLTQIENTFENISDNRTTYTNNTNLLEDRKNYKDTEHFGFYKITGNGFISLKSQIDAINNGGYDYILDFDVNQEGCSGVTIDGKRHINPHLCNNNGAISSSPPQELNMIKGIIDAEKFAYDISQSGFPIKKVLEELNTNYTKFLKIEKDGITMFKENIQNITSLFQQFLGNDTSTDFFSFLNCKFIGNNIRVLLKTLDNSLGGDVYDMGIILLVEGFAMAFSIIFTLLYISMLNESIDKMKK